MVWVKGILNRRAGNNKCAFCPAENTRASLEFLKRWTKSGSEAWIVNTWLADLKSVKEYWLWDEACTLVIINTVNYHNEVNRNKAEND